MPVTRRVAAQFQLEPVQTDWWFATGYHVSSIQAAKGEENEDQWCHLHQASCPEFLSWSICVPVTGGAACQNWAPCHIRQEIGAMVQANSSM